MGDVANAIAALRVIVLKMENVQGGLGMLRQEFAEAQQQAGIVLENAPGDAAGRINQAAQSAVESVEAANVMASAMHSECETMIHQLSNLGSSGN